MSSQQPSCELWMPCRKNEQSLCKCLLVALHIGPNTPQTRKALNSAPHPAFAQILCKNAARVAGDGVVGVTN